MLAIRRPPRRGFGEQPANLVAIQALFVRGEKGGYWPADPAYMRENSAGTTAVSVGGVCGQYINTIAGQPNGIQATTGNKPIVRQTPQTGKYWLDGNTATAAMTVTFPSSLGSACTIARLTPDGVTFLENQTITSTYNLTPPYGYGADVMIINRALTTAEKALVTKVLSRNVPMLGNELVVNGTFDTDTMGWFPVSTNVISVVNNRLRISSSGSGYANALQTINSAGIKTYALKAKSYFGTAPQANISFGDSVSYGKFISSLNASSGITRMVYGDFVGNTQITLLTGTNQAGFYAEFDDISCKEII